jgi:DNA replication licensing factor MCM5
LLPPFFWFCSSAEASAEAIAENVSQVALTGQGELDVASLRKYIQFCRARCSPRLSEEAGSVLTSTYVKIRDDVRQKSGGQTSAVPVTVRQLEALVRISESLAKMRLDDQVRSEDVTEAMRLFKVSTMAANAADQHMDTANSYNAVQNREEMERVESFLKTRLAVGGSLVNKQKLIEEASGQGFHAMAVTRAMSIMASRGELHERNQGRLVKRVR